MASGASRASGDSGASEAGQVSQLSEEGLGDLPSPLHCLKTISTLFEAF